MSAVLLCQLEFLFVLRFFFFIIFFHLTLVALIDVFFFSSVVLGCFLVVFIDLSCCDIEFCAFFFFLETGIFSRIFPLRWGFRLQIRWF